jgi:hypothetical protein
MGRMVDVDNLVGASEIAERLAVRHVETVHAWRRRYSDFPKPVAQLRLAMVWAWPDVETWARRTGHLLVREKSARFRKTPRNDENRRVAKPQVRTRFRASSQVSATPRSVPLELCGAPLAEAGDAFGRVGGARHELDEHRLLLEQRRAVDIE